MTTPIRLVRNNGSTIDLMCTTMVINADRGVMPFTMPFFGGSRIGFDFNLPKTSIQLEGVVTDDDNFGGSNAQNATAYIDFGNVITASYREGFESYVFSSSDNLESLSATHPASNATHSISLFNPVTGEDGHIFLIRHPTNITDATCDTDHSAGSGTTFGSNPKIIKCDSTALLSEGMTVSGTGIATNSVITDILSNTLFKVDLDTTATNNNQTLTFTGFYGHQGYINARSWVGVIDSTTGVARTATQIATDFAALVNLRTSVFGMTATVIDSSVNGVTNVAVKLVQNTAGKAGNTNFPSFSKWPSVADKPYHKTFSGGSDSTSASGYSAGDRVAELYAVLCNSNNGGIGLGNLASGALSLGGTTDAIVAGGDQKYGDYIIGLQIPFSSKVNDNTSLFYMPTGAFKTVDDKKADMAEPVGTEFDSMGGEYTGIKGAVANATFTQLGGEPIYKFVINFVPIDWII